jgi:hypothetical protein
MVGLAVPERVDLWQAGEKGRSGGFTSPSGIENNRDMAG